MLVILYVTKGITINDYNNYICIVSGHDYGVQMYTLGNI